MVRVNTQTILAKAGKETGENTYGGDIESRREEGGRAQPFSEQGIAAAGELVESTALRDRKSA